MVPSGFEMPGKGLSVTVTARKLSEGFKVQPRTVPDREWVTEECREVTGLLALAPSQGWSPLARRRSSRS